MRYFIVLVVLLFFLNSCIFWWTVQEIPTTIRANSWIKKSTSLTHNFIDTIDIDIIYGWIVGDVFVMGKKRSFIFDTGAHMTIDVHDVDREGVKTIPKPDYDVRDPEDPMYQLIKRRKMYKSGYTNMVDTLSLGKNTQYGKVGARAIDFSMAFNSFHCHNILGIIGSNIFKHSVWSFDYKNGVIILSDNISNFDLADSKEFNFYLEGELSFPIIEIPYGDSILKVCIDTGNSSEAVIINNKKIDPFISRRKGVTEANMSSLNLSSYVAKKFTKKNIELVELDLNFLGKSHRIFASTGHNWFGKDFSENYDLVVGYEFLKDFRFILDYINKKIYFEDIRIEHEIVKKPVHYRRLGISLSNYDQKPYVSHYLPHLIDSTKVDIGDTVLAINNTPIDSLVHQSNYCEFIRGEKSLFSDKDTSIITIKNKKGEIHDFKSYKVTLFEE